MIFNSYDGNSSDRRRRSKDDVFYEAADERQSTILSVMMIYIPYW